MKLRVRVERDLQRDDDVDRDAVHFYVRGGEGYALFVFVS